MNYLKCAATGCYRCYQAQNPALNKPKTGSSTPAPAATALLPAATTPLGAKLPQPCLACHQAGDGLRLTLTGHAVIQHHSLGGPDSDPAGRQFRPTDSSYAPNVGASVPLGQLGLSFRYVQTFGITDQAYPANPYLLNRPIGLFVDAGNNMRGSTCRG